MAIIATLEVGCASIAFAVLFVYCLDSALRERRSDKPISLVSYLVCLTLLGASPYAAAIASPISLAFAASVHLGVSVVFTAIVMRDVTDYIDGFVIAFILCISILLVVPAFQVVY